MIGHKNAWVAPRDGWSTVPPISNEQHKRTAWDDGGIDNGPTPHRSMRAEYHFCLNRLARAARDYVWHVGSMVPCDEDEIERVIQAIRHLDTIRNAFVFDD